MFDVTKNEQQQQRRRQKERFTFNAKRVLHGEMTKNFNRLWLNWFHCLHKFSLRLLFFFWLHLVTTLTLNSNYRLLRLFSVVAMMVTSFYAVYFMFTEIKSSNEDATFSFIGLTLAQWLFLCYFL